MTSCSSMRDCAARAKRLIHPLSPLDHRTFQDTRKNTMSDAFDISGRVAVVTGGLGQLGTQFSKSLAEAGVKVAIFSRRPFSAEKLAEKFPGLTDRIRVYEASVTDKAALEKATEQLIDDGGVPHILVNNAGIDSKP